MAERVISVCPHDCPSACSLVVTLEGGRITGVAGNPAHPFTQGVICGKVHDYAERVYSPLRVLTPLRRVGPKGQGKFQPISWDDAVEEIARRFKEIMARWGAEAILPFSYGVAVIEGIRWHKFSPGGRGVNVLTSDRVTDLGGGPALHSNLVEIAK